MLAIARHTLRGGSASRLRAPGARFRFQKATPSMLAREGTEMMRINGRFETSTLQPRRHLVSRAAAIQAARAFVAHGLRDPEQEWERWERG